MTPAPDPSAGMIRVTTTVDHTNEGKIMPELSYENGRNEAEDLAKNAESEEVRRLAQSVLALYQSKPEDSGADFNKALNRLL